MELSVGSFTEYMGYLLAGLAVWILLRCAKSMLTDRPVPEVWGALELSGKERRELEHWECLIGRAASSDIVLEDPSVQSVHASLIRGGDGIWVLRDLSRGNTYVGGKVVEGEALLKNGDSLRFGKVSARFREYSQAQRQKAMADRPVPGRRVQGAATLLLLTLFAFGLALQHVRFAAAEHRFGVVMAFGVLIALGWSLYFLERGAGARGFEPETLALLLTAVGFSVAASSTPEGMLKQSALFTAAAAVFVLLGLWLRSESRTLKLRWVAGGLGVLLLGLTLLMSEAVWGAKNWLSVAGNSLQPSEFVKIAFVYAGAAGLDRTLRRRQVLPFMAFSAVCVGTLALMGDFGTALVFFAAFLVIVFMRSGSAALLALSLGAAAAAVALVLMVRPYVAARFSSWGRAWADPLGAGYQQVRAMSALSAGGLFGRGAGNGWLTGVVAADTDLVFGVVGEELGLIVGVCCLLSVLLLAVFVWRCAAAGRSGYYVIAAAGAVTIYMIQMGLNVFGSMDLVPFTGVTFPFVSRGGSSLIACWGLLAFVKAADTRRGASFALGAAAKAETKEPSPKKTAGAKAPEKKTAGKKTETQKPAAPKKTAAARPAPKKSGGKKGADK